MSRYTQIRGRDKSKQEVVKMFIKLNQRGFTLVEIMIVVAIIGLLAAIAIPNLLRSRLTSNEGAMKLDLRAFGSANEAFRAAQNPPAYGASIAALQAAPAYIDVTWGTAAGKHGFSQTYSGGGAANPNSYAMRVSPLTLNVTAVNTYCIDHNGVILGSVNGVGPPTGAAAGCTGGTPIA